MKITILCTIAASGTLLMTALFAGCRSTSDVKWMGRPVTMNPASGVSEYELGVRPDGVVVARPVAE